MGLSKQQFMNSNEGKQTPRDFTEDSEPCTEDRKWQIEQKLEEARHELDGWYDDIKRRLWLCQHASEAHEIMEEIKQWVDTSSWMRQKDIQPRVDNSVNRKNT